MFQNQSHFGKFSSAQRWASIFITRSVDLSSLLVTAVGTAKSGNRGRGWLSCPCILTELYRSGSGKPEIFLYDSSHVTLSSAEGDIMQAWRRSRQGHRLPRDHHSTSALLIYVLYEAYCSLSSISPSVEERMKIHGMSVVVRNYWENTDKGRQSDSPSTLRVLLLRNAVSLATTQPLDPI